MAELDRQRSGSARIRDAIRFRRVDPDRLAKVADVFSSQITALMDKRVIGFDSLIRLERALDQIEETTTCSIDSSNGSGPNGHCEEPAPEPSSPALPPRRRLRMPSSLRDD